MGLYVSLLAIDARDDVGVPVIAMRDADHEPWEDTGLVLPMTLVDGVWRDV